jgi:hypothetical protein
MRKVGTIRSLTEDGSVILSSGEILENISSIILCTGYHFNFDFLKIPEADLHWR